jgi:hypothetical protein
MEEERGNREVVSMTDSRKIVSPGPRDSKELVVNLLALEGATRVGMTEVGIHAIKIRGRGTGWRISEGRIGRVRNLSTRVVEGI